MSNDDVFGRPVVGKIRRYSGPAKEQADPRELIAALDAVLDQPGVEAVRWEQYTPYFNDGDACVFDAYEVRAKLAGVEIEDEYGEYEDGFYNEDALWKIDTPGHLDESGHYVPTSYKPIDGVSQELLDAVQALDDAVTGGEHDLFLNDKFGDPARVTATKEGFSVDYYDHD